MMLNKTREMIGAKQSQIKIFESDFSKQN